MVLHRPVECTVLSGLKVMASWPKQKEGLKSSAYAEEWFASISTAAMTEHRFLAPDFSVEQTAFSNGRSIIVNFSKQVWKQGAVEVAANSYLVFD